MLLRRQALVMEEQHEPIVECVLDLREGRVVERSGEVHAMNVGAKRAGHRPDLDAGVGDSHSPTIGDCAGAVEGTGTGKSRPVGLAGSRFRELQRLNFRLRPRRQRDGAGQRAVATGGDETAGQIVLRLDAR